MANASFLHHDLLGLELKECRLQLRALVVVRKRGQQKLSRGRIHRAQTKPHTVVLRHILFLRVREREREREEIEDSKVTSQREQTAAQEKKRKSL